MKFQLLIKTKIPTNKEDSCFKSLRCCIYHDNKCENANNCWQFNIYEHDKFRAQLFEHEKSFTTLGPDDQDVNYSGFQIKPTNKKE